MSSLTETLERGKSYRLISTNGYSNANMFVGFYIKKNGIDQWVKTFDYSENIEYVRAYIQIDTGESFSNQTLMYMLVEDNGIAASSYLSYKAPVVEKIPQAICDLPGYGWSAGDVRNEVNWENKQYIQRVDKVDLGTLNWTESGDTQYDGNSTYKSNSLNTVIRRYSTYSGNSICEKFNIVKVNDINRNEYEYSIGNSEMAYPLQFTVKQTFCTDKNDFKNKINGIMLYYELAEPIVTDISDIIGNTFQEPLEVEAGGTLTFKNSNGDNYRIPVSSTEEYLVSLAEVAK